MGDSPPAQAVWQNGRLSTQSPKSKEQGAAAGREWKRAQIPFSTAPPSNPASAPPPQPKGVLAPGPTPHSAVRSPGLATTGAAHGSAARGGMPHGLPAAAGAGAGEWRGQGHGPRPPPQPHQGTGHKASELPEPLGAAAKRPCPRAQGPRPGPGAVVAGAARPVRTPGTVTHRRARGRNLSRDGAPRGPARPSPAGAPCAAPGLRARLRGAPGPATPLPPPPGWPRGTDGTGRNGTTGRPVRPWRRAAAPGAAGPATAPGPALPGITSTPAPPS